MKKPICVLIFALTLLLLVACNEENANITEITSEEQAVTTEKSAPYELKMDLNSYMRYLVNYFYEPYAIGDEIHRLDILTLVFHFCYSNRESLDFVKMDEATLDTSQRILIDGEGLRKTAKMLLGEDFEAEEHHEFLEYASEKYNAETDIYSVPTAKDYWGGDLAYIKFRTVPKITETESNAEVTAIVDLMDGYPVKLVYEFDKVVDDGFLFYRLTKVTSVEVSAESIEKAKAEALMLTDHLIRFVLKPEAIVPYYEFTAEDIFRFLCSLPVYRDESTHPYGDMVKTDDTGEYYVISLEDAKRIAYEVFEDSGFSQNSYPTELYDEESECYRFPIGAGLWTTQFAYEDLSSFEENGYICAKCNIVNSQLYEYPEADYGECYFVFEFTDSDEPYITLTNIVSVM